MLLMFISRSAHNYYSNKQLLQLQIQGVQ